MRSLRLFIPTLLVGACLLPAAAAWAVPAPLATPPEHGPHSLQYLTNQGRWIEAELKARAFDERHQLLADPTPNMALYDVIFYDLDLELQPVSEQLLGTVTVVAEVLASSLDVFDLHLRPNMTVDAVTSDDVAVGFSREGEVLTVTLDRTYQAGELVGVGVTYHGDPASGYFGWSSYDGEPLIWTLSEPYGAHYWWPCKDVNTDKADSVDLHVKVPEGFVVASNGTLAYEEPHPEHRTFHWQERYPIVTYLVSLAIHPYARFSDWYTTQAGGTMEIQHFVVPAFLDQAESGYAVLPAMLDAFAGGFGEYPFVDEKYGHAHFPWGGAMEHQTCTSISYWAYGEWIIAHELGHQWFGDMITCADFHHIWLNEGFATWTEAYWFEQSQGMAAYHEEMNDAAYFGPGTIYVEDASEGGDIFNGSLSYRKASWVVHMLRHILGEDDFFAGLALYRERYGHSSANTEQFQAVMEEVSGLELTEFFRDWIYGEFYPQYEYAWVPADAGPGEVGLRLRLDQVQTNTDTFTMPVVDVRVTTDQGMFDIAVANADRTEIYNLSAPGSYIAMVEIDPDDWILKEVTYNGTTGVDDLVPAAQVALSSYPNPFNPATKLVYELPRASAVRLEIYDVAGRRVATLVEAQRPAGHHEVAWDGRDDAGAQLPSGTYFGRLVAGDRVSSHKLTLVE
jgi:aminopeptidase N